MEPGKILDLENDGLNIAVDGQFIYVRCKRSMYKYDAADRSLAAHAVPFKKDGKARGFSVGDQYIFLTDFCDLHILRKDTLQTVEVLRLGEDLSSDLGVVRFRAQKAYVGIRNGVIAVMDIKARTSERFTLSDSSFWDFCIVDNRIYAGSVRGELLAIDADTMRITNQAEICKKNIYSVVPDSGLIYVVSQDMTIKAVKAESFEMVCVAKKAVKGMARILGVYQNHLVVSDSNKITLWDKQTLQLCKSHAFPTGTFNKGVALHGSEIIGSDAHGLYSMTL